MGYYVGVHKQGMRVVNKKFVDEYGHVQKIHYKRHRWEHWREKDQTNTLHLTNKSEILILNIKIEIKSIGCSKQQKIKKKSTT